jgi:type I restriction enzyme, R subunit
LRTELARLAQALEDYQSTHEDTVQRLTKMEATLKTTQEEQLFWEQMAAEAEQAKAQLEERLAEQQTVAASQSRKSLKNYIQAANQAAKSVQLDEASTRELIDEQLKQAGWEADSVTLNYRKGTRPEKGKNRAIAEWPTSSGPADYVLFVGLMPVATVEAKRQNANVSGALQQAKRYSRDFRLEAEHQSPGGNWLLFVLGYLNLGYEDFRICESIIGDDDSGHISLIHAKVARFDSDASNSHYEVCRLKTSR